MLHLGVCSDVPGKGVDMRDRESLPTLLDCIYVPFVSPPPVVVAPSLFPVLQRDPTKCRTPGPDVTSLSTPGHHLLRFGPYPSSTSSFSLVIYRLSKLSSLWIPGVYCRIFWLFTGHPGHPFEPRRPLSSDEKHRVL